MSNVKGNLKIYETVLSSPGMGDKCKVVMHLSRLNIIVLSRLIETGLQAKSDNPDDIINIIPKETFEELGGVVEDMLKKGDLAEFYNKLKSLAA